VNDERPGQHGLEGGGEASPCTAREVVVVVVALRPLSDSGDLIRVVLIAYDPDDLATIVLKALAPNLDQKAGDIVPAARLGKEFGGDQGTLCAFFSRFALVEAYAGPWQARWLSTDSADWR